MVVVVNLNWIYVDVIQLSIIAPKLRDTIPDHLIAPWYAFKCPFSQYSRTPSYLQLRHLLLYSSSIFLHSTDSTYQFTTTIDDDQVSLEILDPGPEVSQSERAVSSERPASSLPPIAIARGVACGTLARRKDLANQITCNLSRLFLCQGPASQDGQAALAWLRGCVCERLHLNGYC